MKEQSFQKYTSQTITSNSKLREELERIRNLGYAFDRGEHEEGVRCIAAPLRDHNGEPKAAISIIVPSFREDRLKDYAPEIQETARHISEGLKYEKVHSLRRNEG